VFLEEIRERRKLQTRKEGNFVTESMEAKKALVIKRSAPLMAGHTNIFPKKPFSVRKYLSYKRLGVEQKVSTTHLWRHPSACDCSMSGIHGCTPLISKEGFSGAGAWVTRVMTATVLATSI
jgi:hypothetical protein